MGKTAIVTGANSGLGKETARDFAHRGLLDKKIDQIIHFKRHFFNNSRYRDHLSCLIKIVNKLLQEPRLSWLAEIQRNVLLPRKRQWTRHTISRSSVRSWTWQALNLSRSSQLMYRKVPHSLTAAHQKICFCLTLYHISIQVK